MALPATHIRFAARIAGLVSAEDLAMYFLGTLYPDSRWVTGVERLLTHDRRCLDPDFPNDDFTLGWHVHCWCDCIQGDIHRKLLDHGMEMSPDDRWVRMAAGKVVQDMNDAAYACLDDRLATLPDSRTPNGESTQKIADYIDFVRCAYRRRKRPEWIDYARLWTAVGLDRLRISQLHDQVNRIRADDALVSLLCGAFDRMVDQWVDAQAAIPDKNRK